MRQEVKELNSLIEQISQKTVDRTIGERYLISRMAVIVNEFDPITNSASIIIPTDLSHPTTYKYPNRTGKNKLANTVWENGEIKIYGDKVYLIYQTNNISQGWLEDNSPLSQGSMNYEDLTNKPSINGVQLSGNKTTEDLNIHIPTKVSDLDNDSGYLIESNLKTINNNSLVGSGNISINKTTIGLGNVDNTSDLNKPISTATQTALNNKQPTLVSGSNIKTVNNQSLLGSGNIEVGAKFIKGTPINLYDTDGTTILNSENPQNILFYVNDSLTTFDGTIDGFKKWETLWTGTCKGKETISLDVSSYSKLKIYAVSWGATLIGELDLTKTMPNNIFSGYPYCACFTGAQYVNTSKVWEIHSIMVAVNTAKNTIYNGNQGFAYNTTNELRNNNGQYYIYKVEGMK